MNLEVENKLPELCYVKIPGGEPGRRVGIIKRGEAGYYLTDYDNSKASQDVIEEFVDEMNEALGVSHEQATAMLVGSMWGWHLPGADPDAWIKA
jgi:hypothetical protein